MKHEIMISGFGGQGIVFAGKLLAQAAMEAGLTCSYYPSYGIEMRGGAAKCDVIVADMEIGSPVIDRADIVVAMSIKAREVYAPMVRDGGLLVLNGSLIPEGQTRAGIEIVRIDATTLAGELGSTMVATLICLGYVGRRIGTIALDDLLAALDVRGRKFGEQLLEMNKSAVRKGWDLA